MKLDSEHLQILAVIVEKGGLTEGAEALGKSQPSVSRSISILEGRVGMPLFIPGRRPLRPTELGASLAKFGARIHAANLEAGVLIQRYRQGHAGTLRVGGTPIFMDGVISTMIADFQAQHPGVQIDQSYGYLDLLVQSLRNSSLDLAILPAQAGQIPHDMDFLPLLPGNNVIACRSGHPLTRKKAISLAEIKPYSWIAPPENSPLYRDLRQTLKAIDHEEIRVSFSGGTLASIQSVLSGSDALTVLPLSVVFLSRRTIALDALRLKVDHPDRQLGILMDKGRQAPPALWKFTGFLETEFQRLQARMDDDQQIASRRR